MNGALSDGLVADASSSTGNRPEIVQPVAPASPTPGVPLVRPERVLQLMLALNSLTWAASLRMVAVFYVPLRLTHAHIGCLAAARPIAALLGESLWTHLYDCCGPSKTVLLVANFLGVCTNLCAVLQPVQQSYTALLTTHFIGSMLNSVLGSCLLEALGARRLTIEGDECGAATGGMVGNALRWVPALGGVMALGVSLLVDAFNNASIIFGSYAAVSLLNMFVVGLFLPLPVADTPRPRIVQVSSPTSRPASPSAGMTSPTGGEASSPRTWATEVDPEPAATWSAVLTGDVAWALTDIGFCAWSAALVQTFLFVHLLEDFGAAPAALVGAAVAVASIPEVFVFEAFQGFTTGPSWAWGPCGALVLCRGALALRCLAYAALPRDLPWLVLIVEPLHAISNTALCSSASVHLQEVAPAGTEAAVMALGQVIRIRVAAGAGSLMWGLALKLIDGVSLRGCFLVNAILLVGWTVLWTACQVGCRRFRRWRAGRFSLPRSLLERQWVDLDAGPGTDRAPMEMPQRSPRGSSSFGPQMGSFTRQSLQSPRASLTPEAPQTSQRDGPARPT